MGLALGGELLQAVLYTGREDRARSIVRDITEGLKAIHRKGIIHSGLFYSLFPLAQLPIVETNFDIFSVIDIKMANILLTSNDENSVAMIADFGLSRYVKDTATACGGTTGCMAPELELNAYTCGTEM